jgi:hypothetical protein
MEQGRLDFDETAQILEGLSTKAQATFMYKMINKMGPMLLRTIIRYCCRRLDTINEQLPDEHPHKERYLSYGKKRGDYSKVPRGPGIYVDEPRPWRGMQHLQKEDKW